MSKQIGEGRIDSWAWGEESGQVAALFLSGVTGGSSFGECPAHNCLIFLSIHSFIHSLIHAKFLEHLVYAASLLDAAVLLVSRRGSQSRRKVVH